MPDAGDYLVLHGDRFDPTLHWPILTDAADWCYQTTQKINHKAAKWLKQKAKRMGGVIEFLKQKSVAYARNRACRGIITGHTHFCEDEWLEDIHYLNTGCWVEKPCTYVLAQEDRVRLCCWEDSSIQAAKQLKMACAV